MLNGVVHESGYGYGYTGYEGGGGPAGPPPDSPPSPPGGGQPPSQGGGPSSSDRERRKPLGPPDKSGHMAKSEPEPDRQTTGQTSAGPTATSSSQVKEVTR